MVKRKQFYLLTRQLVVERWEGRILKGYPGGLSVILIVMLLACSPVTSERATPTATLDTRSTEEVVRDRASEVVAALRDRDMDALTSHAHPKKGIRFSPYAYVRDEDLVFSAQFVRSLLTDQSIYLWGSYDGSGEPIELTFTGYYERFVYSQDFANAEMVGYNERLGYGNTISNITEFYPNGVFVEYHFSGFDSQYAGLDWVSLRLVFEQEGGTWYLVGIVHDEWTI